NDRCCFARSCGRRRSLLFDNTNWRDRVISHYVDLILPEMWLRIDDPALKYQGGPRHQLSRIGLTHYLSTSTTPCVFNLPPLRYTERAIRTRLTESESRDRSPLRQQYAATGTRAGPRRPTSTITVVEGL